MVRLKKAASSPGSRSLHGIIKNTEKKAPVKGKKISVYNIDDSSEKFYKAPTENRDETNEGVEVIDINPRQTNIYVNTIRQQKNRPKFKLWNSDYDSESDSSTDETRLMSNISQDEEDEDEEEYVDSEEEDDVEEVGDNRAVSHPFIRLDDCTKCLSIMMSTDPLVDNVGEYQKLVSTIHKVPKATVRAKSAKKKSKNKNHVGADDASSARSIEKEVQEKLKFTWSAIMNRDGIDESLQEYHNEQRKMADDPKKFDEDVAKLRATEETLAFVLTAMTDIEKDFDCVTAENLKRVDSAQIEDSDDESSDDCSSIFSLSADSNDSTIESEMFTASLTEYSHVEAPKVEVDCNMLGGLKPKKKGWFSTRRSKKSGKNASKRN